MRDAIGIDPDSKGFICAQVKASAPVKTRGYLATEADLGKFVKWVKGKGDVIVAFEGSNGLSKPERLPRSSKRLPPPSSSTRLTSRRSPWRTELSSMATRHSKSASR